MQQLRAALIDLHHQFDSLDIQNVSFQLRLLDALANNKKNLEAYEEVFHQYQTDKRTLEALRSKSAMAGKELEFINFQLEEFNKVELIEGELEELEAELSRLTNAEDIKRTLSEAYNLIGEEERSIISQIEEVNHALAQIKDYDARLQPLDERLEAILAELQDLVIEFEKIAEDTEYDGERINEVQQRLDLIYRLQNKHNVNTVEELLAIQTELQTKLEDIEDVSSNIGALEKRIQSQKTLLVEMAAQLSEGRKGVVAGFVEKVHKMLAQLAMEQARLEVKIEALDTPGPTGMDEVTFLFSANKGARMQHLKDVASGGEISRLTLVTKSLVASAIPLPTLIFDEIDTGISGDVALKMGNILRELSDHHQVVSITHSPQVASKADAHYFVFKKEKDNRTVTRVRLLDKDERVRAIATMLSQSPPSDSAIENAKELLSLV